MFFPDYSDIDIYNIDPIAGTYSLSLIKQYNPNIHIIDPITWSLKHNVTLDSLINGDISKKSYKWLNEDISRALENNKTVFIVFFDENTIMDKSCTLANVLNLYRDDNVFFITLFDDYSLYRDKLLLQCKILSLSWWLLNESLVYESLNEPYITPSLNNKKYNYVMSINRAPKHKIALGTQLNKENLSKYGLITITDEFYNRLNENEKKFFKISSFEKMINVNHNSVNGIIYINELGNFEYNNLLVSNNIRNVINLNRYFSNIPLIINPETTLNKNFFVTEKSIWPIQLGKLFLIYGRKGIMKRIQKWYKIDFSKYLNLEFDSISDDKLRLELMIQKNKMFISNTHDIYQELKHEIKEAKQDLARNMYNEFTSKLNTITIK